MIIDPSCDGVPPKQLPAVSIESMTQVQLQELISKLVTFSTRQSCDALEKPRWWTDDIPWRGSDLDEVISQDEVGIEVLRELIRGCYKYLGQEDLLTCPHLPAAMKPLPSSPQLADTHLKAAEPSSAKKEKLELVNGHSESGKPSSSVENEITDQIDTAEPSVNSANDNIKPVGALPETAEISGSVLSEENEILEEEDLMESKTEQEQSDSCIDTDMVDVSYSKSEPLKPPDEEEADRLLTSQKIETDKLFSSHNSETDEIPASQNTETSKYRETVETSTTQNSEIDESHTIETTEAGAPSANKVEVTDDVEVASNEKEDKMEKQEDDVVWICFVCAKEFPNQGELVTHQDSCEDSSEDPYLPMDTDEDMVIPEENVISIEADMDIKPEILVTQTSVATKPSSSEVVMTSKSPVLVEQPVISLNTSGSSSAHSVSVLAAQLQAPVLIEDITGAPTLSTVHVTVNKPVPTLLTKVGSQFKSLPLGLPLVRKRKRKRWPDIYIPPPPDTYFNSLGLGPTPKVKEIEETPKKSDKGCEIIDLTLEESQPMTPRTPKSLMSQWSRDGTSGRRRQLSFTQNSQPEQEVEESSSDSDTSESSVDEKAPKRNVPCKSTIYAIPLTSPLGQRLKKNWQNENHVPVVSDIEQYCKTDYEAFIKNAYGGRDVLDKLRHRPPPQVTFRFTKKYLNRYHHSYKFTSADKREFQKKLKTGLERDSRRLLKLMKPCKVVLSRISKKDIKYWTTRGEKRQNDYMARLQRHLKQKIMLEQQKLLGARLPQPVARNNQRFIQYNNLQFHNQSPVLPRQTYPAQFRFVGPTKQGPTPQLLVRHGAGMVGMPLSPAFNPRMISAPVTNIKRELTGSQKRKQDFSNLRVDDEISIISLSSDEEEDACDKTKDCRCSGCQRKQKSAIGQKPRIGPASFKRREAAKQLQRINTGGASQFLRENLPVSAQKNTFSALGNTESAIVRATQGGLAVHPAKSNEFMNFRMVNGQIQNTTVNGPVVHQNPTPHSPLILNKSIIKRPYIQSQSSCTSSAPGSPVKGPCSPIKMGSGAHVHKDEALGFEVIMIDSDDED